MGMWVWKCSAQRLWTWRIWRKTPKSSYSFSNVNCISLFFLHAGIADSLGSCCPQFLCLHTTNFFPHATGGSRREDRGAWNCLLIPCSSYAEENLVLSTTSRMWFPLADLRHWHWDEWWLMKGWREEEDDWVIRQSNYLLLHYEKFRFFMFSFSNKQSNFLSLTHGTYVKTLCFILTVSP